MMKYSPEYKLTEALIRKRKRWGDYQNNTNISLVNNYIYFAVDKVANSSIKRHFFDLEYKPVGKKILSLYDPRCSPLLSPYQLPYSPNDLLVSKDFFKFAFVRNPYSRLLSCYLDRISTLTSRPSREFRRLSGKNEFEFKDFINFICHQAPSNQNSHWRMQSADILYDLVDFDFIGKFETLEQDLKFVHSKIFDFPYDIQSLNQNHSPSKTSADDKIKAFYDQEMADMVYEAFISDFKSFNYNRLVL